MIIFECLIDTHIVILCNEGSGKHWDSALYLIRRLSVCHVVVIGRLRRLGLRELRKEAKLHGLDITRLPKGADVNTALH